MSKDIWLMLTSTSPYDDFRHLFPDSMLIPVKAPFPQVSAGEENEPCYLTDSTRMSDVQNGALAWFLYKKYQSDPAMTWRTACQEVERGMCISHKWCFDIVGDPAFEGDPEGRMWAFEFNRLSNEPSIDIRISPLAAWCLIAQIQLAARHPANDGETGRIARETADSLLEYFDSPVLQSFAAKGWDRSLDIAAS